MVPELEIFRKLADKVTGKKIFECGNPRCGGKIVWEKNKPRPETCGECHEKIDWIGFS